MKIMQELFTKRNILLGTIIILLVAVFSYVENCKDKQRAAEREECQNAIIASAEENGLQDVTVVLSKNTEYDWYEANISCSNFGDFSPKKMIAIYNGIKIPKAGDTSVVLGTVTSGADRYSIYTSSNSVYRNHDCIYEGPQTSKTSNRSGAVKQRNTTPAMTEQEAKALRGSGYHGTRPKSSAEDTELAAAMNKCRKCGMHTTNGKNSLCDACLYNKNHGLD